MVVIVNLLIGTNTPPFGICLFIAMQIARVSFAAITRAVLPFLIPMIATLLLITFFPGWCSSCPASSAEPLGEGAD
jgi:TRAP-type C4-dicarboxylate transport system permease large subunit